jgi:hypothetical protein
LDDKFDQYFLHYQLLNPELCTAKKNVRPGPNEMTAIGIEWIHMLLSWLVFIYPKNTQMPLLGYSSLNKLRYTLGTCVYLYLSLGLGKGRKIYRRSLQPSKENIQRFKR